MERNTHSAIKVGVTALLVSMLVAILAAGGMALVTDEPVSVDEFEAVEVTVDFSGDTTVDATITDQNGETVTSDTIDGNAETLTETYDIDSGDYDVTLTAADDTAVNSHTIETVSTLSMATTESVEFNDSDESIVVDVEITAPTDGMVELHEDGTVVDSSSYSVGTVEDGSEWVSVQFSDDLNATTYDVEVMAEDETAVNQTEISVESGGLFGGGGIIAGASQTQLLGFGAIVIGLAWAYREDYI